MPKARRKPKPVNLHARRAQALGGEKELHRMIYPEKHGLATGRKLLCAPGEGVTDSVPEGYVVEFPNPVNGWEWAVGRENYEVKDGHVYFKCRPINEKIPGPYSGTSCRAPESLPPVPKPEPPPDPAITPATDEERELCAVAVKAVLATVRQARRAKKYQAYSWTGETQANQVAHAFGHVRELQNQIEGVRMREPDEPHAAHLITRAVLLLALQGRDRHDGALAD